MDIEFAIALELFEADRLGLYFLLNYNILEY